MNLPFHPDMLVKDIVNEFPKSSDLFKRNRIDFCCGGSTPLSNAVSERNLNIETIMNELQELFEKNKCHEEDFQVWTNSDSTTIINHIKEHYHRNLEEELSLLSPYVTKVAKVHGEHRPELLKVHELFLA